MFIALLSATINTTTTNNNNNARQFSFACRRNDLPVNVVNALSLSSLKK